MSTDLACVAPPANVLSVLFSHPLTDANAFKYGSRSKVTGDNNPDVQSPDMAGLIGAVAANADHEAFATLFSHYAPRLKSFLMREAGSEAAEEIAQEAMLSVWRKASLFDPTKASAGTWIFTIARNLRIDRLRRESRPEVDMTDPFFDQDKPTPDQNTLVKEQQKIIQEAVNGLPDDQAEVIRRAYYEEQSHSEISDILNIPLGTVKSRLRLAMGRVRQAAETLQ